MTINRALFALLSYCVLFSCGPERVDVTLDYHTFEVSLYPEHFYIDSIAITTMSPDAFYHKKIQGQVSHINLKEIIQRDTRDTSILNLKRYKVYEHINFQEIIIFVYNSKRKNKWLQDVSFPLDSTCQNQKLSRYPFIGYP